MTQTSTFGRRSVPRDDRDDETRHYVRMETVPVKKGWGWGRITLTVLGGLFVLGVIGEMADQNKAASGGSAVSAAASSAAMAPCIATLKEFSAIKIGMSQGQVTSIIGCSGTEVSRVAYGGQESLMLSWHGGFLASMDATFNNDRLIGKTQLGLK